MTVVLRPRLTFKYVLFSVALTYVLYCFLADTPMLASKLPDYTGSYDVGTIDIEAPCESRRIRDAVFKNTGNAAFELETVLFSLYYPAAKGAKSSLPKHEWISEPVSFTAEGYARFARINNFLTNSLFSGGLWAVAGGLEIPASVDVPLLESAKFLTDNTRKTLSQFPIIVFSHGMASSRTDYTQWAGELASCGYVVAALEHRDGSGPGSLIHRRDGSKSKVFHISAGELRLPSKTSYEITVEDLKPMQLAFRQAEMEETVRVLRALNAGAGNDVFKTNSRQEGVDLANWKGRLRVDSMIVAGHSYGATLALQTLKSAPSPTLPFVAGIALDPGKQSGSLNADINVPLLVVHSNSWSKSHSIFNGRPHFAVVKDIVQSVNDRGYAGWFLTSLGTSHPSVTDAPLIEPLVLSWTTGSTIEVKDGLREYVKVVDDFMRFLTQGVREGVLKENVSHPEYGVPLEGRAKYPQEIAKYWEVHVAPGSA